MALRPLYGWVEGDAGPHAKKGASISIDAQVQNKQYAARVELHRDGTITFKVGPSSVGGGGQWNVAFRGDLAALVAEGAPLANGPDGTLLPSAQHDDTCDWPGCALTAWHLGWHRQEDGIALLAS